MKVIFPALIFFLSTSVANATSDMEKPNKRFCLIPRIAREHKNEYIQFFKGTLVFRPDPNSNRVEKYLPISQLPDPLAGEFDLSRCGNVGKYCKISTGLRRNIPLVKNDQDDQLEFWLVPRFLVKESASKIGHPFHKALDNWDNSCPVGIFLNLKSWNLHTFYCLTDKNIHNMGAHNLYTHCRDAMNKSSHVPSISIQFLSRLAFMSFRY